MAKGATIEDDKYMTKEQKILYMDIAKALLKYFKDGVGTVYIDNVKMTPDYLVHKWRMLSLLFKVVE